MPTSLSPACLTLIAFVIIGCTDMGADANTLNNPLYFLPFSHKTHAFELVRGKDAVHPTINTCPVLETGPPELNLNAFLFDGTSDNYAEVKFPGPEYDNIGIIFMIYPEDCNGDILKYEAKGSHGDTVNVMKVQLSSCKLRVIMYDEDNAGIMKAVAANMVQLKTWSVVAISRDWASSNVTVRLDNDIGQPFRQSDATPRQFDLDGKIWISPTSSDYHGRFCCLVVYDKVIPGSLTRAQLIDVFKESNWPAPADGIVKVQCQSANENSGTPILQLWPLSSESYGHDVVNKLRPLAPSDSQCLRYKERNNITGQPVVYFDGSVFSYLQAEIFGDALTEDYSVAIMIRPDIPVEGVVFDLQATPQNVDGICRMTLNLSLGYATLELSDCHAQPCGSVSSTRQIVPNTWTFIYVIVQFSTHHVTLMLDLDYETDSMTCMNSSVTQPNGTITMGLENNATWPSTGYHGSAACLTVIRGVKGRPQAPAVAERCIGLDVLQVNESQDECHATPEMRTRHYKIAQADSRPDVGIDSVFRLNSRSLVECSKFCVGSAVCRAFTFRKKTSSQNCKAYDFVTRSGLVADPGNNYYVVLQG